VEKRHNRRHINLFNAMVKVQKKRESVLQKQQAQANLIAMRKNNENAQQQPRQTGMNKSPRDYSLLRFERDQQMAERMAAYQARQAAERRVSDGKQQRPKASHGNTNTDATPQQAQQTRQAQQQATLAAANATAAGQIPQNIAQQLNQANLAAAAAASRAAAANQFAVTGQARPGIPMQAAVNGIAGLPAHMQQNLMRAALPMNGVNPQLQALQGQQHRLPMPPAPEAHVMMQAKRISEQQRQMQHQLAQQAQSGPSSQAGPSQAPQMGQQNATSLHGSPPAIRNGLNGINAQSFMSNAQSMLAASFNQGHAAMPPGTPPTAALHMGAVVPSGSPRAPVPPALMNQIQALEAQYRQKNPAATPEQARQVAIDHLNRILTQRQTHQQAMNAAAGAGSPPQMPNGLPAGLSPAQYAALVRQQQMQMALHAQLGQNPQSVAAQAQASHNQATQAAAQHQRSSSGSVTPGK
jgi:chromatin modification-related protein VID21